MENSFWLPQTGWNNTIETFCQILHSQLSLITLNQDLESKFSVDTINQTQEVKEKWIYEYILAHTVSW